MGFRRQDREPLSNVATQDFLCKSLYLEVLPALAYFLYWAPLDLLCLCPSWTDQDVMALNLSVTVDEACTVTLDPTCTLCHK